MRTIARAWLADSGHGSADASAALLHAGVVNLGGFLLIRVGGLVADVPAAQALLVVVGSVTAVVAALVMMTRVSIKVSLAWSTCAQMGFMLMQCGLGLHALALLHLVTHSLYKAHAFLAAGGAVEQNRLKQMTPPAPPVGALSWGLGALIGMAVVAGAALAWGISPAKEPALWAVGCILALALVPLLTGPLLLTGVWELLVRLGAAFAVALGYLGLHAVFSNWLAGSGAHALPGPGLVGWVLGCFGLLFVVQGVVRARPQSALARWLYPRLFAGLYLDELFTRLTFRLWPARVPAMPGTLAQPTNEETDLPTPSPARIGGMARRPSRAAHALHRPGLGSILRSTPLGPDRAADCGCRGAARRAVGQPHADVSHMVSPAVAGRPRGPRAPAVRHFRGRFYRDRADTAGQPGRRAGAARATATGYRPRGRAA